MNKFEKALLGGIAGGAKASGEFFADRSKSKESQRKETVIAKRQETLAELKNKFAVAREQTQYDYKDRVRAEEQVTANLARPAGQVINGRSQTRGDMATMSDDDIKKSGAMSQEDYLNSKRDEKRSYDKTIADKKQADAIALAEKRNKRYEDKTEEPSIKDKNYAKEQAVANIEAKFAQYNPILTLNKKGIELEFTGSEKEFEGLKSFVKSSGFPNANIFKGTGKEAGKVMVYSGSYVYKKEQKSLAAPEVGAGSGAKTGLSSLMALRDAKKKNVTTHGSNLNSQHPDDGLEKDPPKAIAAPEKISTINPALPKDPKQWDVQNITQNGKSVAIVMTENGPIELTPEELAQYKKVSPSYTGQGLKGPAIDYFKKNLTGTQQIIK